MKKQKRGSVLATVLMVSMLLAIITAVVANNTLANYKATNWSSDAGNSRYVAYAGIQHALVMLYDNPDYNTGNTPLRGQIPGYPNLTYEVSVKNQRVRQTWQDGGGLRFNTSEIPENSAKLESIVVLSDGRADRSLAGMVGTAIWQPTAFENAAYARSSVYLSGDSSTRAYNFHDYKDEWGEDYRSRGSTDDRSGYVNPESQGQGQGQSQSNRGEASVRSTNGVHIDATSKVEGDVVVPPPPSDGDGGTVNPMPGVAQALQLIDPALAAMLRSSTWLPDEDRYTGEHQRPVAESPVKKARPPYARDEATQVITDFPATTQQQGSGMNSYTTSTPYTLEPAAYKSLRIPSHQTVYLKPGRYYVSEDFVVNGKIEIAPNTHGDVLFFVGQKMEVGGDGEVNFHGDPARMQTYFTDEDRPRDAYGEPLEEGKPFSTLILNRGARATMVAEGAGLIAKLNGARLLGALAANVAHLNAGSRIEYDTNLKGRQMAGGSPWKLQGVYETVLR